MNNSVAPRFKYNQMSMTAGYKQKLNSVLKGDKLSELVTELQGGGQKDRGYSVNQRANSSFEGRQDTGSSSLKQ